MKLIIGCLLNLIIVSGLFAQTKMTATDSDVSEIIELIKANEEDFSRYDADFSGDVSAPYLNMMIPVMISTSMQNGVLTPTTGYYATFISNLLTFKLSNHYPRKKEKIVTIKYNVVYYYHELMSKPLTTYYLKSVEYSEPFKGVRKFVESDDLSFPLVAFNGQNTNKFSFGSLEIYKNYYATMYPLRSYISKFLSNKLPRTDSIKSEYYQKYSMTILPNYEVSLKSFYQQQLEAINNKQ